MSPAPGETFVWRDHWYPVSLVEDLDSRLPIPFQLLNRDLVIWKDPNPESGSPSTTAAPTASPPSRSRKACMAAADGVARQAELRRIEGNACFNKACLGAAIDCYTEAIALCPDVAVYWMNRGLCHFRRKEWAKVEEDSRRALALDDTLVKGHYLLGCALLEKEECLLSVKEFEKALDLLKPSNSRDKMAEDIWQVIAKAKYLDWEKHSTQRVWKMQHLKEACENALQEHHFLSGTLVEDSDGTINEYSEQCKLLSEVFTKATHADTPTDVPDYLCCKITFEIFKDPVITPSGVTYERTILLEHLHKVGNFDPVTREPLKEHQLVPNLAIKEAVQAYLKEHSWAYKLN